MITSYKNAKTVYTSGDSSGVSYGVSNGVEVVHLSIAPGDIIPSHALPFNVTFFVSSGDSGEAVTGYSSCRSAEILAELCR
ncbi:hypothetical protein KIPB_000848 [Kipferlia bialata]|uniref:Uncharacterized protein n=1 Tax=Kipferlia bialata TaxID=797122 RepID=A0A9K3CP55_9EUKA|nr:hypothetical protein KIPB_000848 [Kipferlia bialata]|eukprot:g848.t1